MRTANRSACDQMGVVRFLEAFVELNLNLYTPT
jgi:hypothetical protein